MKRILATLLLLLLCFLAGCGEPKSREIKLADIGRNVNFSLNEGVRFLRESHNRGLIGDAPYAASLRAAKKIQVAADHANAELDALATLDASNKLAVINALDGITNAVREALNDPSLTNLAPDVSLKINNVLTGFSLSVNVARTLVAAIKEPTPKAAIKFQFQGVN